MMKSVLTKMKRRVVVKSQRRRTSVDASTNNTQLPAQYVEPEGSHSERRRVTDPEPVISDVDVDQSNESTTPSNVVDSTNDVPCDLAAIPGTIQTVSGTDDNHVDNDSVVTTRFAESASDDAESGNSLSDGRTEADWWNVVVPVSEQQQQLDEETADSYEYCLDLPSAVWQSALCRELARLSRQVWYWGPLSPAEAVERLADQPHGTYLVRQSCHEQFYFTLSFRTERSTGHVRIEYDGRGTYWFYGRHDYFRAGSVEELVAYCIGNPFVGCFGVERVTVRLTRPLSRLAQIRSLQYLCHFVIRQHARVDKIGDLPLPTSLRRWLQEQQS